jgi:hypothetical protein
MKTEYSLYTAGLGTSRKEHAGLLDQRGYWQLVRLRDDDDREVWERFDSASREVSNVEEINQNDSHLVRDCHFIMPYGSGTGDH